MEASVERTIASGVKATRTLEQANALSLMLDPALEQAGRLFILDERHAPEVLAITEHLIAAKRAAISLMETAAAIYHVDILDGDH